MNIPYPQATLKETLSCCCVCRVMDALREHLGVPPSLRVCFALEVARLQLTLLLFGRQSITCDRNCEGGLPGKKRFIKNLSWMS
jgi:hypothetical protein